MVGSGAVDRGQSTEGEEVAVHVWPAAETPRHELAGEGCGCGVTVTQEAGEYPVVTHEHLGRSGGPWQSGRAYGDVPADYSFFVQCGVCDHADVIIVQSGRPGREETIPPDALPDDWTYECGGCGHFVLAFG